MISPVYTPHINCYSKCVYSECYQSLESMNSSMHTHICMASHTPNPDVARTSPQQETESRAFHHSNSSKQLCRGEKPETYQVEQVWKLFLPCLFDFHLILDSEILSADQHVGVAVKPEYAPFQAGDHL